jgi:hypothetical protein
MPIEITNFQFIFIKPQHPYLAVAKDNRHFISLTETEMQKYTVLSNGLSYVLKFQYLQKNHQLCKIQLFKAINSSRLPKQYTVIQHTGCKMFNDSYF